MNKEENEGSVSGVSLLSPKPHRKAAPQRPVVDDPPKTTKYAPPPSSLLHKLVMGTAVVLPFIGVLVAIALTWSYGFMGWFYLAMLIGGWQLTGLGVTIGLHRLATHRSFDTYPWIRALWLMCG